VETEGTQQRGHARERFGAIVSEGMWRVLACPVGMLKIGIIGD